MNRRSYIKRGFKKKCPACGEVPLYIKFLKTYQKCKSCGIKLSNYKSDDGPAYLTIFIVGHIIIPLVLLAEKKIKSIYLFPDVFLATLNYNFISMAITKNKGCFYRFSNQC